MQELFLIVPSAHPTGPVKGAVALANAVVGKRKTTLVFLKTGPGIDAHVDKRVRVISFENEKGFCGKLKRYRQLLRKSGGRQSVVSLSFCFSADMLNLLCRDCAVTGSSLRGNLFQNYRFTYGMFGVVLAAFHLASMRGFDHVIAMNTAMARQVRLFSFRSPAVIGNFVDESPLEKYRKSTTSRGPLRFVFVASLSPRKQPQVLLNAVHALYLGDFDIRLDIVGDGPARKQLTAEIDRLGLGDVVTLHGHLPEPYPLVAQADLFVLPSFSEGLSRACLEALYLGVPCLMRDIDGNSELIRHGVNGGLFKRDKDLPHSMQELALWARSRFADPGGPSLLTPSFRQAVAAQHYIDLLE